MNFKQISGDEKMNWSIISIALLVVTLGAFGALFVMNKKDNPNKGVILPILFLVGFVSFIAFVVTSNLLSSIGLGASKMEQVADASSHYYSSQGYVIGEEISNNNPSAKVLVLFTQDDFDAVESNDESNRSTLFIEALKDSFDGEVVTEAIQLSSLNKLTDEQREMQLANMPFSAIVVGNDFNTAISKHSDADTIIVACTLPAVPYEAGRIKTLNKKNNKDTVYLLDAVAKDDIVELWLNNKSITGAVDRKRGFKRDGAVPRDLGEAFSKAYDLRTN